MAQQSSGFVFASSAELVGLPALTLCRSIVKPMKRVLMTCLVGALAMFTAGCSLHQKSDITNTGASGNTANVRFTNQYQEAKKRALKWQPNATLTRVYRSYHGSLAPNQPVPLVFAFASLADPAQAFNVSFVDTSASDQKEKQPSFALNLIPVPEQSWAFDPDKALQIAEDAGGRDFRQAHLAGYTVLEQLQKNTTSPTQWYFRYDTGDGSHLRWEAWVNAQTGHVDQQRQIST